jgi:uncharacterized protein YifN (PemK superfamily)
LVEVRDVARENGVAKKVIVLSGDIEITYILGKTGRPMEVGRKSDKQIFDNQSCWISRADYCQTLKMVSKIFSEKRKAPAS